MPVAPRSSKGWVLCADILGFKNEMTGDKTSIKKKLKQLETLWTASSSSISGTSILVSDSLFIHWPCATDETAEVSKQFTLARGDVRNLLDRFCSYGFFLRGSIAYGDVIMSSSMWAGAALFRAHTLESSVINAPLVVMPENECARISREALSEVPSNDLTTKEGGILRFRVILPRKLDDFEMRLSERYDLLRVHGPADAARKINNALTALREIRRPI